jgi:hypothetical protein
MEGDMMFRGSTQSEFFLFAITEADLWHKPDVEAEAVCWFADADDFEASQKIRVWIRFCKANH